MSGSIPRIKPLVTRERIETVEAIKDLQRVLKDAGRDDDARSLKKSLDYWLVTNETVDYERLYAKYNRFHKEMVFDARIEMADGDDALAAAIGVLGALGIVGGIAAWSAWDDKKRAKKNKTS